MLFVWIWTGFGCPQELLAKWQLGLYVVAYGYLTSVQPKLGMGHQVFACCVVGQHWMKVQDHFHSSWLMAIEIFFIRWISHCLSKLSPCPVHIHANICEFIRVIVGIWVYCKGSGLWQGKKWSHHWDLWVIAEPNVISILNHINI